MAALPHLPQRHLGARGPRVGALGYGCMGLSGVYGAADDTESIRLLHHALDAGVTHLDTADAYGDGHNERLLARVLATRRDDAVLATKFGVQRDGLGRPEAARAALEASLRRLDTDHVDVYYLHRLDKTTPIEDTVGALAELVAAGKIGHIGLSEVTARTLRRAHAVYPITVVQQEYSLFSREPESELLPATRELGVGLVAYSPFGRGLLTGSFRTVDDLPADDQRRNRYPRFDDTNLAHNLDAAQRLEQLATEHGTTASHLALRWVLARGEDIVPIPGTRRAAKLDENITAAAAPLQPDVVEQLNALFPAGTAAGERYTPDGMRRLDHADE